MKSSTPKPKLNNKEETPKVSLGTALLVAAKQIKFSKKEKTAFIILALAIIIAIVRNVFSHPTPILPTDSQDITLQGHTYHVLSAKTPEEIQNGLMFVNKPVSFDGMQFLFPKSAVQHFWNQNTHLDLTLYWMQGDTIIGQADLPSIDHAGLVTVTSPKPADKVVEIIK